MYITQLGLSYLNYEETVRHNKATEAETERANVAKEQETIRSNLVKEAETERHNREEEKAKLRSYQEDYRQFNLSYQLNKLRTYLENADGVSKRLAADTLLVDFLADEGIPNPYAGTVSKPDISQPDPSSTAQDIAKVTKKWADKLWGAFKNVFGVKKKSTSTEVDRYGNEVIITEGEANIWDVLEAELGVTRKTIDRALDLVQKRDREIPGVWDQATAMTADMIKAMSEGDLASAKTLWEKIQALTRIGAYHVLSPILVLGNFGQLMIQWEKDQKRDPNQVKASTKDKEDTPLSPVEPIK